MLNLIKTNYKNLQIDFVINRFKLYFSNNLLSKYIHIKRISIFKQVNQIFFPPLTSK